MKINHNFFSNLALNLAEQNLGKTKTNPSVGCVIVKDEKHEVFSGTLKESSYKILQKFLH